MSQEPRAIDRNPLSDLFFRLLGVTWAAYAPGGLSSNSLHTFMGRGIETRGPQSTGKKCWRKRGKFRPEARRR
jgi:hypothetical protein